MNIGLFTETFLPVVDGVGRVVVAYAETLSKLGHQVTVSAPHNKTVNKDQLSYQLIDYRAVPIPKINQYQAGFSNLDAKYKKQIAKIDFDIVHAHSPFLSGYEALRIAKQREIPLIATFHSKFYDDFYKITKSKFIAKQLLDLVMSFFNKCDEVWAVSSPAAEVLRSYGYQKQVTIMPNGVEMREVKSETVAQINRQFNLGDIPVFLYVGQINWKKNLIRILEAAALLKKEGMEFKLALVGQGPDMAEVKQKARELGLSDMLVFTGHINDINILNALYTRALLFAFPSLYDNAPMVLREAAAAGTPAVLIKGSDAAEGIEDRKNGYLCLNLSEDLALVFKEAINNPQNTANVGLKAKETIPVHWDHILTQTVERYQYLIEQKR